MSNISAWRLSARKTGDNEYGKKREGILAAAASVFREKGYEAANVDDIAKRAGLDRASIYYYFKGKKEMFREMIEEAMTSNVLMAERVAATEDSPVHQLRILIAELFESYERYYPYLFVYVQEDMNRLVSDRSAWSNRMRSLAKRFDQAIIRIVQAGIDDGSFRTTGDARVIAAGITGLCNWSHRWFKPQKHEHASISAVFADMVLNGLAGQAEPRAARPVPRAKAAARA
jgi:TetR/AcrR family transcriptional regulator, cholesterol catabolism regulator